MRKLVVNYADNQNLSSSIATIVYCSPFSYAASRKLTHARALPESGLNQVFCAAKGLWPP